MVELISSRDNTIVKNAIKIATSSKARKKDGSFFVEGLRLSLDAVETGVIIKKFFYTKNAINKWKDKIELILNNAEKSFLITENISTILAETKTPQGIFCICEAIENSLNLSDNFQKNSLLLGLENIQDPSNMGTIIRTAEALGIDGLVLSNDCCDIFSPKVVRGSMGGIFRIPFLKVDDFSGFINKINLCGYKTYASTPERDAEIITNVLFSGKTLVVIGNEGNGISENTMANCYKRLNIPMNGRAESLNASVAANIIMWEMTRNR